MTFSIHNLIQTSFVRKWRAAYQVFDNIDMQVNMQI